MIEGVISFEEWQKIDLRVAKIIKVEDIEGADKLYKLTVDIGPIEKSKSKISTDSSSEKKPNQRTICAGIKEFYSKDELKGKKIIIVTNLEPRKIRGIESQGMLLAAVSENEKNVVLITPEKRLSLAGELVDS